MKKLITLALCAVLALALCVPAAAFSDVAEGKWYADAADFCAANGLMDGFPDDTFRPTEAVTRAQLVTVLWRLAGRPEVAVDRPEDAPDSFSDVKDSAWYAPAVRWAVAARITEGTGHGRFSPSRSVTREMLATFFHRFADRPAAAEPDFADASELADWAKDAVAWAKAVGLMQGVGENRFDPKTAANRAALAQTLMNYVGGQAAQPSYDACALDDGVAPVGVAKDAEGTLYITDGFGKALWKLTGDGCERVAGADTPRGVSGEPMGGYLDGAADKALFASPWGVAPFLGGWAVSDPENNTVRVLRGGQVSTANGIDFHYPTGLAADGEGRLYVANTHSGEILLVTPEGESTVAADGLDEPMGLCFHDGALYIADVGLRQILKLQDGSVSVVAGSGADGNADGAAAEASFFAPEGVAVAADGSIYVSDAAGSAIRRIKNGFVTTLLSQTDPLALTEFPVSPVGLLIDGGTLYVCDRYARMLATVELE